MALRDLRRCRQHDAFRFSTARARSEPRLLPGPDPTKVAGAPSSTTRAMWVAAMWARTVGEVCLKPKREARLVPRLLLRKAMPIVGDRFATVGSAMRARKLAELGSRSKRSTASRLYCWVRYDLLELVLPSGIPDPPGTPKPVKLSLLEHGEVQPLMTFPPRDESR